MPAICPPVRPLLAPAAGATFVPVPDGVVEAVAVIGFSDEDATIGSCTPWHRSVVLENTQHESVLFGELAAQYEHSDPRFDVKPQLFG